MSPELGVIALTHPVQVDGERVRGRDGKQKEGYQDHETSPAGAAVMHLPPHLAFVTKP
jgi:hypothetical protein